MNKTQQLLKSREELFDKEFGDQFNGVPGNMPIVATGTSILDVKRFHATTISLLLNSLQEEIREIDFYSWNADTQRMIKDKVLALLSETISNIQTK